MTVYCIDTVMERNSTNDYFRYDVEFGIDAGCGEAKP